MDKLTTAKCVLGVLLATSSVLSWAGPANDALKKAIDGIPAVKFEAYRLAVRISRVEASDAAFSGIRIDGSRPLVLVVTPKEILAEMPIETDKPGSTPEKTSKIVYHSEGRKTTYWPGLEAAILRKNSRDEFWGEEFNLRFFNPFWRAMTFHGEPLFVILPRLMASGNVAFAGEEGTGDTAIRKLSVRLKEERAELWLDQKTGLLRRLEHTFAFVQRADGNVVRKDERYLRVEVLEYNTKQKPAYPSRIRMTTNVGVPIDQKRTRECVVEEFAYLDPQHVIGFKVPEGTAISGDVP